MNVMLQLINETWKYYSGYIVNVVFGTRTHVLVNQLVMDTGKL